MLDPDLDRALYRQLADLLRADIRSGVYGPGTPIPSEAKLIASHGIGRNTVRLAMEVLRDEGLVVTRQGRGTFVLSPDAMKSRQLPVR
ncbi:GntR family transcriptional regulator [Cryptosporangium aurantiacum]|uniref:Regulatory protein, gntR family n=1 Tax=Cryptosporangium aurantiacum TaxID=134849 RepID=A0A1M7Q0J5_9ACTN|nr:winged helix-turn-helix domain-containing protein [Cryptosporangium aurantiacum]SHN23701.1 regulatory protein, gntR family [Cryptosporangium aurantiacum]